MLHLVTFCLLSVMELQFTAAVLTCDDHKTMAGSTLYLLSVFTLLFKWFTQLFLNTQMCVKETGVKLTHFIQ